MNKFITTLATAAVLALPFATAAHTDGHDNPFSAHIAARHGQMNLMAFNISTLGGMARGTIEYDAEAAQVAAGNLATLAMLNGRSMWPEGSDNGALGDATRALPAIWENGAEFGAAWGAYIAAVNAMNEAAGGGLEALQGAIGPLGAGCGGCHRAFRQSDG